MRLVRRLVIAVLIAAAGPARATQEDREGWYLVKAAPGAGVTVTQHAMTEYGCDVQAGIARQSPPGTLADCVYLQAPAGPASVPVSPRRRLPASYL